MSRFEWPRACYPQLHNVLLAGLIGCAGFIALVGTTSSRADEAPQPLRELPPLLRSVSDEPGVLSLTEGQELSRRVAEIAQSTWVEIIVVILTTAVAGLDVWRGVESTQSNLRKCVGI